MRHSLVAALQIAVLLPTALPASSQDMASAADGPAVEHVRHLRPRKAAKPLLATDEDKQAPETVEATPAVAPEAKPSAAETAKTPVTRQKKVAVKPTAAKPAAAKPRSVAHREIASPALSAETRPPAPASRGFLEDIFGDN